jgi:hypothetical protein
MVAQSRATARRASRVVRSLPRVELSSFNSVAQSFFLIASGS